MTTAVLTKTHFDIFTKRWNLSPSKRKEKEASTRDWKLLSRITRWSQPSRWCFCSTMPRGSWARIKFQNWRGLRRKILIWPVRGIPFPNWTGWPRYNMAKTSKDLFWENLPMIQIYPSQRNLIYRWSKHLLQLPAAMCFYLMKCFIIFSRMPRAGPTLWYQMRSWFPSFGKASMAIHAWMAIPFWQGKITSVSVYRCQSMGTKRQLLVLEKCGAERRSFWLGARLLQFLEATMQRIVIFTSQASLKSLSFLHRQQHWEPWIAFGKFWNGVSLLSGMELGQSWTLGEGDIQKIHLKEPKEDNRWQMDIMAACFRYAVIWITIVYTWDFQDGACTTTHALNVGATMKEFIPGWITAVLHNGKILYSHLMIGRRTGQALVNCFNFLVSAPFQSQWIWCTVCIWGGYSMSMALWSPYWFSIAMVEKTIWLAFWQLVNIFRTFKWKTKWDNATTEDWTNLPCSNQEQSFPNYEVKLLKYNLWLRLYGLCGLWKWINTMSSIDSLNFYFVSTTKSTRFWPNTIPDTDFYLYHCLKQRSSLILGWRWVKCTTSSWFFTEMVVRSFSIWQQKHTFAYTVYSCRGGYTLLQCGVIKVKTKCSVRQRCGNHAWKVPNIFRSPKRLLGRKDTFSNCVAKLDRKKLWLSLPPWTMYWKVCYHWFGFWLGTPWFVLEVCTYEWKLFVIQNYLWLKTPFDITTYLYQNEKFFTEARMCQKLMTYFWCTFDALLMRFADFLKFSFSEI